MRGTSIHNNYVHHTGTEGMYIGSTAYEGTRLICDSVTVNRFPPVLDTVEVYENEVSYTGWDGIQISDAIHVKCYRNTIMYDSQKDTPDQNCGLIIGGGASGDFFENTIEHGKGYAINCFGKGPVGIIKNTIVMDSASNKIAVYISDKLADKATNYTIFLNDIQTSFLPVLKIVNAKGRKPDWIKENNLHGADLSKAIVFQGVKPKIK
jgi:Right handed beta helix region